MTDIAIPPETSPKGVAAARQVIDAVVQFTDFDRIQQAAISDINLSNQIKMPIGHIILAESGMGKSLLLELIKRALTQADHILEKSRPILSVSLDSAVDTHKLAAKVMLALGYPMLPSRPNLENMNGMIDKAIERLKPKALFIDECQHMCEGNRDITARAVTDWLKVRMDKHNLPFLGAGTHTFDRIGDINPQFTSRSSARYTINAFHYGESWSQLLLAFTCIVTNVNLNALRNEGVLKACHVATKGNLRNLKRLLLFACISAADRAEPALAKVDLEVGFDRAFGLASRTSNPFRNARK